MLLGYDPFQLFNRLERELLAPLRGTEAEFGWMPMNAIRKGDVVEVTRRAVLSLDLPFR